MTNSTRLPLAFRIVKTANVALLSILIGSVAGWAQTPAPAPGKSGPATDAYQPTEGAVSAQERAAGIAPSQAQQGAQQHELNQIYQNLMGQQPQPSSPPPGPPK